MDKLQVATTVDRELLSQLELLAEQAERSLAGEIRLALRAWVAEQTGENGQAAA